MVFVSCKFKDNSYVVSEVYLDSRKNSQEKSDDMQIRIHAPALQQQAFS